MCSTRCFCPSPTPAGFIFIGRVKLHLLPAHGFRGSDDDHNSRLLNLCMAR